MVFKKIALIISPWCYLSLIFSEGDFDTRLKSLEEKLSVITTINENQKLGVTTALARPDIKGYGYFARIDVLYWHARLGGTEYAYTNAFPAAAAAGTTAPIQLDGNLKEVKLKWDWGLKVGLGYRFEHDGWESDLTYTCFEESSTGKTRAQGLTGLFAIRGNPSVSLIKNDLGTITTDAFVTALIATSNVVFNFNNLDLLIKRHFFISGQLSLTPFFGLRSTWLTIRQTTRYSGGSVLGNNTVTVFDMSNMWGIGPSLGLFTKWDIGHSYSVIGNLLTAIVEGYFKTQQKNRYSASSAQYARMKGKIHRFVPMVDMQLGLSFDKDFFYKQEHHLAIALLYEVQYLFRVNQMLKAERYYNNSSEMSYFRFSEDASMHGVTLDIRLDF